MTRQRPRAQSGPRFAAEESLQRAVAEYLALCVPAAPTAESDMNDSWLPPRAQDEAHEAITLAGGVVTTCRSLDDVVAFLETLGVPSRAEVWCDAFDPPVPSLSAAPDTEASPARTGGPAASWYRCTSCDHRPVDHREIPDRSRAADRHATGKALETFLVDQFG